MRQRSRPAAVLLDLLMATMDSISTWTSAAGDVEAGLRWRDAVTGRMIESGHYLPYETLVVAAAEDLGLAPSAWERLRAAWLTMHPWPDAGAVERLGVPYAFVTNCSAELATLAAERSGLGPAFTLSAEEAGWYKPRQEIYRMACERLGTPEGETRFVAGAAYDARGASAAGLETVLVARREPRISLPEVRVVSTLDEALDGA